jgi:hypothetical protein
MHPVTHNFYVKSHPRQKLCHAIPCTSVATMQLHHPICHMGINTWPIIAALKEDKGGGVLLQYQHLSRFERSLG